MTHPVSTFSAAVAWSPRRLLAALGAMVLVLLCLDAIWLSTMASRLYRPALGNLMRETPDWLAAGLFYALYLAGLLAYAVRPVLGEARWTRAARSGAGFGLVAYATYDLTNQATLVGWPWHVTVVDLVWGMLLSASATVAAWWAARRVA